MWVVTFVLGYISSHRVFISICSSAQSVGIYVVFSVLLLFPGCTTTEEMMLTFYAFRECRVSHAVVWARRPEQQTMLSAVRCFLKFALNRASYIHTNTRKTTLGWKMMRPKRLLLYIRTPPPTIAYFICLSLFFFSFLQKMVYCCFCIPIVLAWKLHWDVTNPHCPFTDLTARKMQRSEILT